MCCVKKGLFCGAFFLVKLTVGCVIGVLGRQKVALSIFRCLITRRIVLCRVRRRHMRPFAPDVAGLWWHQSMASWMSCETVIRRPLIDDDEDDEWRYYCISRVTKRWENLNVIAIIGSSRDRLGKFLKMWCQYYDKVTIVFNFWYIAILCSLHVNRSPKLDFNSEIFIWNIVLRYAILTQLQLWQKYAGM